MRVQRKWRASAVRFLTATALLLAVLLPAACENDLTAVIARDEEFSTKLLQASTMPATSHWITGNEAITIQFSDPVDTATLVMSGTLGIDESDTSYYSWSDTTYANDTLTLTPPPLAGHASFNLWPAGSGMTVVVSAESTNGKVMNARTFAFDVEYRYCVDDGAGGSGNGSRLAPLDTVQGGIDAAAALYAELSPASEIPVLVAVGTYSADCQYDATYTAGEEHWVAFMKPGVSLHGGYDSTFLALHGSQKTIFSDSDTDGGNTTEYLNPASVVYIGSTVTGTPVIEKITVIPAVSSAGGGFVCAVHVESASPKLRTITVTGASSGGPYGVWGMFCEGASALPEISNPAVDPGTASGVSVGLFVSNGASPEVSGSSPVSHFIKSGAGAQNAFGVYYEGGGSGSFSGIGVYGPATSVAGGSGLTPGTVDGGCVYLSVGGTPSFTGNTFYLGYGFVNDLYVFYEGTSCEPAEVTRNDFAFTAGYSGNIVWYYDSDSAASVNSGNHTTQSISTGEGSGLLMSPSGHDNYSSTIGINYP